MNIKNANLLLPHQCLLVDHETQSGRWWSACQCHGPDKDVSLPLYKSLHPCCCGVNLGLFTSGWTSEQKAICQWLICIQAISSVMWSRLTTPSAYSLGVCWVWRGRWEGGSSCFHATARLLGGNSSLTRQAELTAFGCFSGSVMHQHFWEYSSLHRSVIDPLCLQLMLNVTPSHPVSHQLRQLTSPHYLLFPLSVYLIQERAQSSTIEIMLSLW